MNNINKKSSGIASLLIILAVVVVAGVGGYLLISNRFDQMGGYKYSQESTDTRTPLPVSESVDNATIQAELDATVIDSTDQEFIELSASASAL